MSTERGESGQSGKTSPETPKKEIEIIPIPQSSQAVTSVLIEENESLRQRIIEMEQTINDLRIQQEQLQRKSTPPNASSNKPRHSPMPSTSVPTPNHRRNIRKRASPSSSPTPENRQVSPRKLDLPPINHRNNEGLHYRHHPPSPRQGHLVEPHKTNHHRDHGAKKKMSRKPRVKKEHMSDCDEEAPGRPDHVDGDNDEYDSLLHDSGTRARSDHSSKSTLSEIDETAGDDGEKMTFGVMICDRAVWLVGLLILQSMSSFIIARNEELLHRHGVIVQFLTMLVGAGGNAGNQATVRVIRGLAVGTVNDKTRRRFLVREFAAGLALSALLGLAGCIRALVFQIGLPETVAITVSLMLIVLISVLIGASLPLGMKLVGIDPAHSSTTIQVIMDIMGVTITVCASSLVLDSAFGKRLGRLLPGDLSVQNSSSPSSSPSDGLLR